MAKPTVERLREVLRHDPVLGRVWWRVQRGRQPAGAEAGTPHGTGYTQIRVDRCSLFRHQIIWALETGAWPADGQEIDHRHGIAAGDGFSNLRVASRTQQMANTKTYATNTSGQRGVYWKARDSKWSAGVWSKGIYHFAGTHERFEDAAAARNALAARLHGEFMRV